MRDAARRGGIDNVRSARPQAERVHHVVQFLHCLGHVKGCVMDGRFDQIAPQMQSASAHIFLAGAKGHFIHTGLRGLARFAKARAHAGHVL